MKTRNLLLASAAALTASVSANEIVSIPTGTISVHQNSVLEGTAPTMDWSIQYPSVLDEIIDETPDEEIIPKVKLRVKVSMVGVGITNQRGTEFPASVFMKFGSNNYQNIYTGVGSSVQPDNILVDRIVDPGDAILYAARVNVQGFNFFFNSSDNITILRDGDNPPSVTGGFDQASVASYLRPYLKDGKIALGERDIIYVSELTHTDSSNVGYDQQDAITLVTFEEVED